MAEKQSEKRWAVEWVSSSLKCIVSENVRASSIDGMTREVKIKIHVLSDA